MGTLQSAPRDYYITMEQEEAILKNLHDLTRADELKWSYSDENGCDVYECRFSDSDKTLVQLIASRKDAVPSPEITMHHGNGDAHVRLDPSERTIYPLQIYNFLRTAKARKFITNVSSYLSDTNDK